jgi:hypothetical protein
LAGSFWNLVREGDRHISQLLTYGARQVFLLLILAAILLSFVPHSLLAAPPPAPTCPCLIWSSSTAPTVVDAGAGGAVELGLKFTSTVNRTISGSLLASATFTGETASGWQTVMFTSPVSITAGTVYVASYYTSASYFAGGCNVLQ